MVTLPGVRFTAFPCFSFVEQRKNPRLSFFFTTHSNFSRKIFTGKSSCGSRFPSPTVIASEQELKSRKCKSCNLTLLSHTGVGCNITRKLASSNNSMKKSPNPLDFLVLTSPSHSHMKFMLMCGFITLQSTRQAIAGSDIGSRLQSIPYLGDLGDIGTGFASALLLIFFSELGDKTFFIAALLAARNSAAVVFLGTFGALAVMTIISVFLGRTFHFVDGILPFRFGDADLPIDDLAAVCLLVILGFETLARIEQTKTSWTIRHFYMTSRTGKKKPSILLKLTHMHGYFDGSQVYFGISSLLEASSSDGLKAEEEQKEAELAVSELSGSGAGILAAANTVFSTFLLVFVAEWGDKSFFSTIALAAASSPLGVIAGALAGHGAATLLAVLGGSFLGTYLSEKVIAYIGGTLFLVFAAVTLIEIIT